MMSRDTLQDQFYVGTPEIVRDKSQGEFFWDSVTKYVAGVIIGLAAIDTVIEFIRGSKLTCLLADSENFTDKEFINIYCASSVPKEAYFSSFISIHAVLILIPNAFWTSKYCGSFDYFFRQCQMLDRTRDYETGEFSPKNYTITRRLEKVFTNYRENWIFLSYVLMLFAQLAITLVGFTVFWIYFTHFESTFLCPSKAYIFSSKPTNWPLKRQVVCVMKPLTFYSLVRLADLFLLGLLIITYIWSLIWCSTAHSVVLGAKQEADFLFQSGIPPQYYVFDSTSLRSLDDSLECPLHFILSYIPVIGSGPHIKTNLDFLLLKLFRADNSLGNMIRKMLILSRVKYLSNNDRRIVKLHRTLQKGVEYRRGDIASTEAVSWDDHGDIKWIFPKKVDQDGLFNSSITPLGSEDLLVLPPTLRGMVIGFASLCSSRKTAMFITFGSPSAGIPCALARVFEKVVELNFNPHYNVKGKDEDTFYHSMKYISDIQVVTYPEDILSSTDDKFEDWKESITKLQLEEVDFLVIDSIHRQFNLTNLSLCLIELTEKYLSNTILLTFTPTKIGGRNADHEFFEFYPPEKYFKIRNQCVEVCGDKHPRLKWPPCAHSNQSAKQRSKFILKAVIGETECSIDFKVYSSVGN